MELEWSEHKLDNQSAREDLGFEEWASDWRIHCPFLDCSSDLAWNRPGFRKVNPILCIVVIAIVLESVAITYRTHFNRISQTYLIFTTSHVFIYYIIQRVVIQISEYKPFGLKENKLKAETISSLLSKLDLHEFSPQATRTVARAILHIFFLCRPFDSFTRILHLSGYPQGRDRFMSPSVCKLCVDANGIRVIPRIG